MGSSKEEGRTCCTPYKEVVVVGLQNIFHRLGLWIGLYPWQFIAVAMVVVAALLPGVFIFMDKELNNDNVWLGPDHPVVQHKAWVEELFPTKYRYNILLVENGNILTPESIQAMYQVDKKVKNMTATGELGYTWNSICASLIGQCWSNSLLELWSFDEATINALSTEDIIEKINTVKKSPVYRIPLNMYKFLGGVTHNETGHIVAADATIMLYSIKFNGTNKHGMLFDPLAASWEMDFEALTAGGFDNIKMAYPFSLTGLFSGFKNASGNDMYLLVGSFILAIVFACVMLGRLNMIQHRLLLSLAGILTIILTIAATFGICSYAGLKTGPLHSLLPYLFLGLGLNFMYVLSQAWERTVARSTGEKNAPVYKRLGTTMRFAGPAMTITSLVCILIFAVCISTIMPGLRSFSVFACVGCLITLLLQCTLFAACFGLNEQRVSVFRDACCACYKYDDGPDKSENLLTTGLKAYANLLNNLPVKIIVVVVCVIITAICAYGTSRLERATDLMKLLAKDYPTRQFIDNMAIHFPESATSIETSIYIDKMDYFKDFATVLNLVKTLNADEFTRPDSIDCWASSYNTWLVRMKNETPFIAAKLDDNAFPVSEASFYEVLMMFMFVPPFEGLKYSRDITFNLTTKRILASKCNLVQYNLHSALDQVAAFNRLTEIADNSGLNGSFPYNILKYTGVAMNKAVATEAIRILALLVVCVAVPTLVLMGDLKACLFVLLATVMTMLDVMGVMHVWGLTLDTMTYPMLIIASALVSHLQVMAAHSFMAECGSNADRLVKALSHGGLAVLCGGLCYFLAVIVAAVATSYVFQTLFKVFMLSSLFGLLHAMVFLPAICSFIGLDMYNRAEQEAPESEPMSNKINEDKADKNQFV